MDDKGRCERFNELPEPARALRQEGRAVGRKLDEGLVKPQGVAEPVPGTKPDTR